MNWLRNTNPTRVQQRNFRDCSIAALAMALDCKYEDVGTDNPLTAQETASILFQRGRIPVNLISREAAQGDYKDEYEVCGKELLTEELIRKACIDRPAILTTQGYKELHAVYWTGAQIVDPSPSREHPRNWSDYKVLEAVLIY